MISKHFLKTVTIFVIMLIIGLVGVVAVYYFEEGGTLEYTSASKSD